MIPAGRLFYGTESPVFRGAAGVFGASPVFPSFAALPKKVVARYAGSHGANDDLLCSAEADRKRDLSDVRIVNGVLFPECYDPTNEKKP